jgi:nucleoside-diphosphate-sugar epimerase
MLHVGWVYGPGDRAFLPALTRQIQSGFMPIWSPPGFHIHLVYIEDLVDAIVHAATNVSADNEEFLILDDASGVEFRDLCDRIAAEIGTRCHCLRLPYSVMLMGAWMSQRFAELGLIGRAPLTTADVKSFGHCFRYSAAKARAVLRWSPQTPFEQGISAALKWQTAMLRLD